MKANEYTEKYMEDNPDVFPQSSLDSVFAKIKREVPPATNHCRTTQWLSLESSTRTITASSTSRSSLSDFKGKILS
jgi:hypothetical protein